MQQYWIGLAFVGFSLAVPIPIPLPTIQRSAAHADLVNTRTYIMVFIIATDSDFNVS